MKKVLSVFLLVTIVHVAYPQGGVSEELRKHYMNAYEQAVKYGDIELGINALNNAIIEMPPAQGMLYKDTLSMLYFTNKAYLPSYLLAQEVFKADPTNMKALGRIGECYQANGDYQNAADAYEKAAPALKNSYYYYELATCQYNLKKINESKINADKAIADTNSNHLAVVFVLPNGTRQEVPVSAAAVNLKGVILMDAKNYTGAKEMLQTALKIFPDFQGAQQNIVSCDKYIKPKGKN
jgi:tetratricopeptide (TPR) repeat protein